MYDIFGANISYMQSGNKWIDLYFNKNIQNSDIKIVVEALSVHTLSSNEYML